jgi:hypothetical protein
LSLCKIDIYLNTAEGALLPYGDRRVSSRDEESDRFMKVTALQRRSSVCGVAVFQVSAQLRDIEELLFEHGVIVSYETVRRGCDKFGAGFARGVIGTRRRPGTASYLDEVSVTCRPSPTCCGERR